MNNIISIHPDMIIMRDISIIKEGDRLFYELGHKKDWKDPNYDYNWIKEGKFKEIENVIEYINNDKLLSDINYLEHHNFMLIQKF